MNEDETQVATITPVPEGLGQCSLCGEQCSDPDHQPGVRVGDSLVCEPCADEVGK